MNVRPTALPLVLGVLALVASAVGCLPSSFDLAAKEAHLLDPAFTPVFEDFLLEEGETTVVGRNISYRVDSYVGVWRKEGVATIAVLTTPSVNAMTFEANPVADMSPRALLQRVLDQTPPEVWAYAGLAPDTAPSIESEEFARLPTSVGTLDGSRFTVSADGQEATAFVVQGRHGEDIIVIGVLMEGGDDDDAMDQVRAALATLEHPAPSEEGEESEVRSEE